MPRQKKKRPSRSMKNTKTNKRQQKNRIISFSIAIGIILVGLTYIVVRAAPTSVSVEAEAGTLSGGASAISDTNASGGKYVNFASSSSSTARFAPPDGKTYLGVAVDKQNMGAFLDAIGRGRRADGSRRIVPIYNGFTGGNGSFKEQLDEIDQSTNGEVRQMTPMVSWNVVFKQQGKFTDDYIRRSANEAKAWGKPVFIRMNWEMNGSWSANYDSVAGGVPASSYVESWKRIHDIFKGQGVTNVTWVWCPNIGEPTQKDPFLWYPGDQYVDWLCIDVYPDYSGNAYSALTQKYGLNDWANYARNRKKPLMLGEWARGSNDGVPDDSRATFDVIFGWAHKAENVNVVKALIYFDIANKNDHVLETHPKGAAAFREYTVGNPRYDLEKVVQ